MDMSQHPVSGIGSDDRKERELRLDVYGENGQFGRDLAARVTSPDPTAEELHRVQAVLRRQKDTTAPRRPPTGLPLRIYSA